MIIREIEDFNVRMEPIDSSRGGFELFEDRQISANLSGGVGAFFVRSILSLMHINEHHVFKWHLENKYMQYLIFNHYCPGCMPTTYSLSAILNKNNSNTVISSLFKHGYFLKATLGHGSGRTNSFDRTSGYDRIIASYQLKGDFDEEWIVQKKVKLSYEYRIHTFDKKILYGLTFNVGKPNSGSYNEVEAFLKGFLDHVPESLFWGTLIGWDIGLDQTGSYYIIEANFTGFHPEYRRGFQTTGFVEDNSYGPICCALLNWHWKYNYGTFIDSISNELFSIFKFYKEYIFYMNLFSAKHLEVIQKRRIDQTLNAIIYWGNPKNYLITKLISYFHLVNFADQYYVIIQNGSELEASRLFLPFHQVQLIFETSLFTADQYLLVNQLSYQRKTQICRYHVLREMKLELALMF